MTRMDQDRDTSTPHTLADEVRHLRDALEAALAENTRLNNAAVELLHAGAKARSDAARLASQVNDLTTERDRLLDQVDALGRHTVHSPNCRAVVTYTTNGGLAPCSCGYSDVMARLDSQPETTTP